VKSLLGWLHLSLSSVNCILCPLALQAMRTHSTVDSFGHTCNSDLYSTRTPVTSLDLTPLFFNRPQTTIHHNKAHHIFFPPPTLLKYFRIPNRVSRHSPVDPTHTPSTALFIFHMFRNPS